MEYRYLEFHANKYITKIEHNGLGREWRVIGEKGYYWEDAYSKNAIIPESNLK